MEEKLSPQEVILEFIKKNLLFVGLISLGIVLVIIGLFQYFSSKSSNSDIEFTSSTNSAEAKGATDIKGVSDSLKKISVDVEGKVQKPGVYTLYDGARLQDALIAAGGLASTADRVYVSKHLNQAQKALDGGKIYIPAVGEIKTANIPVESVSNDISTALTSTTETNGLININSATEAQLDTLPKIGPVTAKKIISGRPYGNINELLSKKILGQKTYDGLKDRISSE